MTRLKTTRQPDHLTHAVEAALEAMLGSGVAAPQTLARLRAELPELEALLRAAGAEDHLLEALRVVQDIVQKNGTSAPREMEGSAREP